jgi:hypothetical protein
MNNSDLIINPNTPLLYELCRREKAAKLAPRPASGSLRPLVHCPTQKVYLDLLSLLGKFVGYCSIIYVSPYDDIYYSYGM